jgi:DNA/RNA-binding domain of Phe-tRNA-synthetase-like protein
MNEELGFDTAAGFLDPGVADELPGLRLTWARVPARQRPSPPGLVRRLGELSNRVRGADVIAMRTKPIPSAYRSFFRQIGLDPDATRVPSEQAAVSRLFHGGFRPRGLVEDVLLVALIETGVPLWALDGDRVDAGGLGIRTSAGEVIGAGASTTPVSQGTLVVADRARLHAILFGEISGPSVVGRHTRQLVLYAVAVPGVPDIHVEEAFWVAQEALSGPG